MSSAFKFTQDSNNIGKVVFDLPNEKINKLSQPVIEELEKIVDELSENQELKALVFISGKPDVFIAGADLHSFEAAFNDPVLLENALKTGHRLFNKIAKLPFPTIAVIQGACLGGGLEFALACTYRVASDHPKTQIGLPEVSLGLYPGWGGTQRLPRLIGLTEGLQMILGAKPVNVQKAYKLKLVDGVVAWEFFDTAVSEFISNALSPKGREKILSRRKRSGLMPLLLEGNPIGRALVFRKSRQEVLGKTKGHYPAPLVALKVIEEGFPLPLEKGLEKEIQGMITHREKLAETCQNLIHLFFIQEALKKDPGVATAAVPQKINSAGILGAGTMGSGIAWLMSNNNIPVRLKDVSWEILGKGYGAINKIYQKLIKIKKLKPDEANLKFHQLSGTVDYTGFQDLDIVIEAATENLDLKNKILSELEEKISEKTIIGTNTSSLSVSEMAEKMKHPDRFVGMHFFNPVDRMPLVEIVPGKKTSKETVAAAVALCKKLNKTPIVVGDCPGFLVNRVFVAGANEINWLFQDGVEMEQLEQVMLRFGMPMSPFLLSDEVGNDVANKVSKIFEKAYGERMKAPDFIRQMDEHKLYGKKSGKGFYLYDGKKNHPNPEIKKWVSKEKKKGIPETDEEIRDRIFFVMINEAARCLEEKIIEKPAYLDMALIMGTGFPPFRGGLLKYADSRGISTVVESLKRFNELNPSARYEPCAKLLSMQKGNETFYL